MTYLTAWLICVAALALAEWVLAWWSSSFFPEGNRLWADAHEFRHGLRTAAIGYALIFAVFWLLVFALGAGRPLSGNRSVTKADALLLAGLVAALLFCFLQAAPGVFAGPINACARHYLASHPADPCFDCGIHSCEAAVGRRVMLAGALIVGALLAGNLWSRWRARAIEASL